MASYSPFEALSGALLDTLVSHVLETCPELAVTLLSACGTRIHGAAVRVLFARLIVPDDARYFLGPKRSHAASRHPIDAVFLNPDRYARAIKQLCITDVALPTTVSAGFDALSSLGLVTLDEEDSDVPEGETHTFAAFEPMSAENLTSILAICTNLEEFFWKSSNPPPDGVCETLSERNPRLVNFTFKPEPPFRATFGTSTGIQTSGARPTVPKWDAPSLSLLAVLPLAKLHITRLSQQGSRALAGLFSHLGEFSLLEDVYLDFVWLDDPLCEKLVEAGRRIKLLKIGTNGTKLTDRGIVSIFEGCDSLESFGLIEAQGRLSRNLWSKISTLPSNLSTFKVAISESGPHHSWTADHLLSFSTLQLDSITHLSVIRIMQPPRFSRTTGLLEHDMHTDDVAVLKCVPKDVVGCIRDARSLTVLECDWWAWKPDDVKALLERCTQLEHLKLAFDAPFAKLLTLTSTFSALTKLLKLSVSIPPQHSPGPCPVPIGVPVPASPRETTIAHPLTPAASPVRRRTSLPSPEVENPQIPLTDDAKCNGSADPSLPLIREVKRFVKKCPRLVELEWYGRNARGRWLISRSVTTSKINTNVSVEHHPPVVSPTVWERASREMFLEEVVHPAGFVLKTMERQGQTWAGLKAEQLMAERMAEKEREDSLVLEKQGRSNGAGKRSSTSLTTVSASASTTLSADRRAPSEHSPVLPFTPLSPPTSAKSFGATTHDNLPSETSQSFGSSSQSPRRAPSEPSLRTNGANGRARSSTASGGASHSGSGASNGRGRSGPGGHRDGRGRGSGKPGSGNNGGGSKRTSTNGGGGGGSGRGGGSNGRAHVSGRGKRKASTNAH